jgi:L-asparagine transporter-like permease
VIANLVAAAIIYILGVLAGLLPRNSAVLAGAVAYLCFIAWFSLTVVGLMSLRRIRRDPQPSRRRIAAAFLPLAGSVIACGLVMIAVPFTVHKPGSPSDPFFFTFYIGGAAFMILGSVGVLQELKHRRKGK